MKAGLIAATIGLIGAAEGVPPEMLDPIARMGAVGVLGFLVVWQAMKGGPAKDKLFSQSLDKLSKAIDELRSQCAAVRKD